MTCEHEWNEGLDGGVACRKCQRCAPTLLDTLSDLARVTAERDEAREVVEAARLVAYNGSGWGLLQPALAAYDAGRGKP